MVETENVVPITPAAAPAVEAAAEAAALAEALRAAVALTPAPSRETRAPETACVGEDDVSPARSLTTRIDDVPFMRAVTRLRALSEYLMQVPAHFPDDVHSAARLGWLNVLEPVPQTLRLGWPRLVQRVPCGRGRRATATEWDLVEDRTQLLWSALPEAHKRKFIAAQVPAWFPVAATLLLMCAAACLLWAYIIRTGLVQTYGGIMVPFMCWVSALGAMGAATSILMNALSVQDDATFDLSRGKLVWLRMLLGALVGTMLYLPLGFTNFRDFLDSLGTPMPIDTAGKQAAVLLMPFLLGFSTPLVIMVLDRLAAAAQTFFGQGRGNGAKLPSQEQFSVRRVHASPHVPDSKSAPDGR